jgi:apolipoprotein N-acyltransferase
VDTYSATWGLGPALGVWLASIAVALVNASLAAAHYDAAGVTALGLAPLAVASASVVLPLLRTGRSGSGRRMEAAAGLWVLTSYVTLGGIALWAGGGSG